MTQRDFLGSARSAATRSPAGASSPGSAQKLGPQTGTGLPAQHPVHPGRRAALPLGLPSRRERCRRVPASLHAKRAFAVAARRQIRQALHRCLGLHTIARRADHRALQPAELVDADPHEQSGRARPHATAQPGLPDLWEASPQGRLPDPLYREMACLLRPQGGAGAVWLRRAHLPGPGRLQSAGHRRTGARLSERPGHFEPGRQMDERPLGRTNSPGAPRSAS